MLFGGALGGRLPGAEPTICAGTKKFASASGAAGALGTTDADADAAAGGGGGGVAVALAAGAKPMSGGLVLSPLNMVSPGPSTGSLRGAGRRCRAP